MATKREREKVARQKVRSRGLNLVKRNGLYLVECPFSRSIAKGHPCRVSLEEIEMWLTAANY